MPPAVALGVAAVGSVAGAAIGASAQKKAAAKAADAQTQASADNNALSREIYDKNSTALQPYNQVGLGANPLIAGMIQQGPYSPQLTSQYVQSMNPGSFEDWKDNTGFDFNLMRGIRGGAFGAGASGTLLSGSRIKGAIDFGNQLQSRTYGDYRNALSQYDTYADQFANQERGYQTDQRNNYFNWLTGQQGVGLNAVGALAGVGNNYSSQVIGSNNQAAAATGNAALASGAATAGLYSSAGNALGSLAGQYFNPYGSIGAGSSGYHPYGGTLGAIY